MTLRLRLAPFAVTSLCVLIVAQATSAQTICSPDLEDIYIDEQACDGGDTLKRTYVDEEQSQAILSALQDPVDETRVATLQFLQTCGLAFPGKSTKHWRGITEIIAQEMLNFAKERKFPELTAAIKALGKMGPEGSETAKDIARFLGEDDPKIQQAAIEALGQMGVKGAVAAGEFLNSDQDQATQRAAAEALGKLGAAGAKYAKKVTTILGEGDPKTQRAAIKALGQMGVRNFEDVDAVANFLNDDHNRDTQRAAIEALGEMGVRDAKYVNGVAKFLDETQDYDTRLAAIEALGKMGAMRAEYAASIRSVIDSAYAETYDSDPQSVSYAMGRILRRYPYLDQLGQIGARDKQFADITASALQNEEDDVRAEIEVLGRMGANGARYVDAVANFLKGDSLEYDEGYGAKLAAIRSLGEMGTTGAKYADNVASFLKGDQREDAKIAAIEALGKMGAKSAKHAEDVASFLKGDQGEAAKIAAVEAIGKMGATGYADAVAAVFGGDNPSAWLAAIEALGKMGPDGASAAEKFLHNAKSNARIAALLTFENIGSSGRNYVDEIRTFLSKGDPKTQRAAIEALSKMGADDAESTESLATLLNSADRKTRDTAQAALRTLATTQTLTGQRLVPLCLEAVLSHPDEAGELRLTCHLLGPSGGQELMQWVGNRSAGKFSSPKNLNAEEASELVQHFVAQWPTIDARDSDKRPLMPMLREAVAQQISEIATANAGRFELGNLPQLESTISLLSSAGFSRDAAALRDVRDQVKWWGRIRTGMLSLIAHASLWALLLVGYRRSPMIQSILFWNPWARRFFGLFYVGVLITVVPYLRRLMFVPFKEQLSPSLPLEESSEDVYFPDSEVVEKYQYKHEVRKPLSSIGRGRIYLEGASGLGKTQFLLKLARTSKQISVILKATECGEGVVKAIQARLEGATKDAAYLKSLIHAGAMDVFIDGLNEAPPQVRATIVSFVSSRNGIFVLTTQPTDWNPPENMRILWLQPLRGDQVEDFMKRQWGAVQPRSQLTQDDYETAVLAHIETLKNDDARLAVLSNPMDATLAAELIARGERPDEFRLVEQHFATVYEDVRKKQLRFRRLEFADHVYKWRSRGERFLDPTGFDIEISALVHRKLMIEQTMNGVKDNETYQRWWFSHEKFMEYCLLPAFTHDRDLRLKHASDSDDRFFGVYELLAVSLTDEQDLELITYLVEVAADTGRNELLNRYTRARRRRKSIIAPDPPRGHGTVEYASLSD